jgi:hypothetical protein
MRRFLVVLCLFFAHSAIARAQPAFVLRATVLVDGKPTLSGTVEGTENPPAAIVWRYLVDLRLRPEPGVAITADPGDPLKATLRGDILVRLQYTGQADREVHVQELRLTRKTPDSDWSLDLDEVRRVARAAGLFEEVPLDLPVIGPAPPPQPLPEPPLLPLWMVLLGSGGLGVLVAVILIIVVRMRWKARQEAQKAKA